eukprot:CAMPEP_0172089942 /NCGR_PEP_ID=MMETSP1043-20130122/24086_1 /TAXON_ID=464988 /ORGANISM="Hemiselmis andersenii, Strain CCMP441" /LENGTH=114 /DNA_ID=CAMNT_0012752447 /DNA_START=710 /DNA_END=1054 /DNA_ORIENTATION=-
MSLVFLLPSDRISPSPTAATISATVKTPSPSPTSASFASGVSGMVTHRLLGEVFALELPRLWLSGGRVDLAVTGLRGLLVKRSMLILESSESAIMAGKMPLRAFSVGLQQTCLN